MKKALGIIIATLVFVACKEPKDPTDGMPLQIVYAEHMVEEQSNGQLALFLLSELEDSIDQMSDSVQTRYHLVKTMAMNVQANPEDTALNNRMIRECEAIGNQAFIYQQELKSQHRHRWMLAGIILSLLVGLGGIGYYVHRQRRHMREMEASWETASSQLSEKDVPLFSELEEQLNKMADAGSQVDSKMMEEVRRYILSSHPQFFDHLSSYSNDISHVELQLCMLSLLDLRQKQVSTLLGISQQNLRNLKVRLYTKLTGNDGTSVQLFTDFIHQL